MAERGGSRPARRCWKDKLLTYNLEDCAALRKVTEFLQAVGEASDAGGDDGATSQRRPGGRVGGGDRRPVEPHGVGPGRSSPSRTSTTSTSCAYFDYQREKVFVRTSKALRRQPSRASEQEAEEEPPGQPGGRDQQPDLPLLRGDAS